MSYLKKNDLGEQIYPLLLEKLTVKNFKMVCKNEYFHCIRRQDCQNSEPLPHITLAHADLPKDASLVVYHFKLLNSRLRIPLNQPPNRDCNQYVNVFQKFVVILGITDCALIIKIIRI